MDPAQNGYLVIHADNRSGELRRYAGDMHVAIQVDDVDAEQARLEPALLPNLPDRPAGVQIGAEHMGGREADIWVVNVPAEVGRLFRASGDRAPA